MRAIFIFIILGIFMGGYWYFVMAPTAPQVKKETEDHASLIGKEIPLVTMSTIHDDEPTKNILVTATVPTISLVSAPQIAQDINKTLSSRADLQKRDFYAGISSSTASTTGNFNTFALEFSTATATEKFIAWNVDTSYQYASMPIASTTKEFIAFRLDTGAMIDKEQLAAIQ